MSQHQFMTFVFSQIKGLPRDAKHHLVEEAIDFAERRFVLVDGEYIVNTNHDEIIRMLSFALWIFNEAKQSAE